MKLYCEQHYRPSKGQNPSRALSLETAFTNLRRTNNLRPPELVHALNVCIEANRPLETDPVDQRTVDADVAAIRFILSTSKPSYHDLFRILLLRSDSHIQQIATVYQELENRPLEEGIRRCKKVTRMTSKIAEHAIRSAVDLEHRDLMLLRRAIRAERFFNIGVENDALLALRMVRAHWYRNHWRAVRNGYLKLKEEELATKVARREGSLGKILVSLSDVR
jgi:hypothetical protein